MIEADENSYRVAYLFDLLFVHLYGDIYIYRDKEKKKEKSETEKYIIHDYTIIHYCSHRSLLMADKLT